VTRRWPDVAYIRWAKTAPRARINLARSSVEPCPPELLGVTPRALEINVDVHDGYTPLISALARRYRVGDSRVFAASGGASFANWLAGCAALHGARRGDEVIVERPTYEPLLRLAESSGLRLRRLDRRHDDGFAIDLPRFRRLVNPRTRLAIVTSLHNPSGAAIDRATLTAMADTLAGVGAQLLVDEVYGEFLFAQRTASAVHAGDNVLATNSLTKAYGLDGLRAGWILGPPALIARAWRLQDLWANNSVAAGDQLARRALQALAGIRRHTQRFVDSNRQHVVRFLGDEPRLDAFLPGAGNVIFPRLPRGLDGDRFAAHLLSRHSTLVVPGRFFEAPRHFRFSFACPPAVLARGLTAMSRALDELQAARHA
jgi:aspartate/methionine/tyrosine aminotransferase